MSLEDTLRLGPVNLPVRYLAFVAAAAAGYTIMSLVLRNRHEHRRAAGSRFLNALALFVVVWKLEPMGAALAAGLARGRIDLRTVLLQVFVPGGRSAAVVGAAVALIYLIVSVHRAGGQPWKHAAAVGVAVLPTVLLFIGVLLVQKLHVVEPTTAAASAGSAPPVGTAVGDRAPIFGATSLAGKAYRLADARGRVIVLNFWATWCPPCQAELPDLIHFASSHPSRRIAVWAVNMTNSEPSANAVRSFSQRKGIDFPVLLDPIGSIAHDYGVTALPTTFIISNDGVIVAKQVGAMSPGWLRSRTSIQHR